MSLGRMAEHYTPKANKHWQRKLQPRSLKTLCLDSIINTICNLEVGKNVDKAPAMSKVLYDNLPVPVLDDMLSFARQRLLSPKNLIKIMEVVPKEVFERRVDLIGNYRGTECCKSDNSLNWLYGFIPEITVGIDLCKQLYGILRHADLSKLSALSLWAAPDSLKPSGMPNIVARAKNLTKLVLRGGSDDHLLRIIGKNCVCLKYLDVSRSPRITNKGIRKLFLVKPESKTPLTDQKTPLATTLNTFIVSISGVNPTELYFAARYMDIAYVETILPEYILTRVKLPDLQLGLKWKSGTNLSPYQDFDNCISLSDWNSTEVAMRTALGTFEALDIEAYRATENRVHLYAHENTYLLKALFTVTIGAGITELSLFWDKFNWDIEQLIFLADLANAVPNVERLKCRLRGAWDWPGQIFTKLRKLDAWCLEDSTLISFLGHCPSLQTVDFRNVRAHATEQKLTDEVLLEALEKNPEFMDNIEDLIIRPTDLTMLSLMRLHKNCPKLHRIGDLECWHVTEDDIAKMNQYLENKNSSTTLVVLSFPPNLIGVT